MRKTLPTLGQDWLDVRKPKIAYMDLETFSNVELKTHGARRYAENAEILLWLWADGDGEPQCWDVTLGEGMPSGVRRILDDPGYLLVFHNGLGFDVPVVEKGKGTLIPYVYGSGALSRGEAVGLATPHERVWDTLHQALSLALPASLDKLGKALGLPEEFRKKAYGKDLIHTFCKPRAFCHGFSQDDFATKAEFTSHIESLRQAWIGRATRLTHPKDWAAFVEYGLGDIRAMRECFKRMPRHNLGKEERKVWYLDSKINDRGLLIDQELCHAVIRAVDREQAGLRDRVRDLTEGEVKAATQRDALLAFFLAKHGLELEDLSKATVARLLEQGDLPDVVRELLEIRQSASKSSTAKHHKILACVSGDGRLRGSLLFCGASRTGRWSGRDAQLHNLPQPKWGKKPMGKKAVRAGLLDMMVDAAKSDTLDLIAPDVMEAGSALVRSTIVAPPGRKLVVSDLAGIEARVLPWMAGERGVVEAFRAYDRGEGADQYKVAYGKMFGVDPASVQDHQRQTGKVIALATQFLGGVGAIVAMSMMTGTDIETQIADLAYDTLPEHIRQEAGGMWEWAVRREEGREQKRNKIREAMEPLAGLPGKEKKAELERLRQRLARLGDATFGLSEKAFVTCDGLKRMWREGNPATVRFWGELEDAVRNAINNPGQVYEVGDMLVPDPDRPVLKVARKGTMTWIELPSGRRLYYPHMCIRNMADEDADDEGNQSTLAYMGVRGLAKQWQWIRTHKGVISENCTQAVARDVLAHGMLEVENDGYPIILTVHDEIITETPDDPRWSVAGMAAAMCRVPAWAKGLPLAAEGFETYRYRKG